MTAIRGALGAVDELGAAYRNDVEDIRAVLYHALGGVAGVLSGFDLSVVPGSMEVDLSAGRALVEERGVDVVGDDRGYYLFADTTTTVPFDAASVADRCDAIVFAWPDPQYGALGAGVSQAGPQIVVVKGVSGSTVPRTDAEINTAVGPGGWMRYADVVIDSTDTEINPANVTLAEVDPNDRVGKTRFIVKTADEAIGPGAAVQNDDHLFTTVVAGGKYHVQLRLSIGTANGGQLYVRFTHPGGTITFTTFNKADENDSGDGTAMRTTGSPSGTLHLDMAAQGAGNAIGACWIDAYYEPTADGVLQFQWAPLTVGPWTMFQGSFMRIDRIA